MRNSRRLSMLWVLAATALVWLLALLPILHVFFSKQFTQSEISQLMGYAPNQFLFILLLPFPLAAFLTFVALRHLLLYYNNSSTSNPILGWFLHNWPVAILVGSILASTVAAVDSIYTARTFDRLQPAYARKAIASATALRSRIESSSSEQEMIRERNNISKEAKKIASGLSQDRPVSQEDILRMPASGFMKIVLDVQYQKGWSLLNPTRANLAVLQTFITLLVASITLIVLLMLTLVAKEKSIGELAPAVEALKWSIIFFAIYPICYRYFRAEMLSVSETASTIGGDILSTLLIGASAYFVLSIDPSIQGPISFLQRAFPFLVVIGPSIYSSLAGPLSLRSIIGTDSNFGSRIALAIIILLVGIQVVASTWPYPKGQKTWQRQHNASPRP